MHTFSTTRKPPGTLADLLVKKLRGRYSAGVRTASKKHAVAGIFVLIAKSIRRLGGSISSIISQRNFTLEGFSLIATESRDHLSTHGKAGVSAIYEGTATQEQSAGDQRRTGMKLGRFLLGVVAAATLSIAPAAAQDKIVVGAYPANPPWEFKTESGAFEGFEVDVAAEVGKRLGKEVEFQDMGFQALFAATSSGRIDFAISSISVTNDRLQNQSFTQPYYDSDGTVVGREDSTVASLEDLKGKVIGVVAGTTGDKWANENKDKLGISEIRSYNAQQDLLLDVRNGRVEGGAGELAGFQYAMTQMPGLKILVRIPTGERFAMMSRKDHPLVAEANDAISAMKEDGTLAAIHKKWFGVDPDEGTSTVTVMPLPKAE